MPTFTGTASGETLSGTSGIDNLYGLGGDDTLFGLAGDDWLDGGDGGDTLNGGDGSDHYLVDNASDVIVDGAGQGDDWLHTGVSYTLGVGVSVETMTTTYAAGTAAINLTGNAFGQSIYGNAGNNVLNGGGGVDFLVGLGGNDRYFVDDAGDNAIEVAGEGDDWLSTSVSYALASGTSVELMNTTNAASTANLDLWGNQLGQSIYGNAGNNIIRGMGGSDYLVGLEGNDVFIGGAGNDVFAGGAGQDVFVVNSTAGVDTITDFDGDLIDLGLFMGFQQFSFIGANAFSGAAGQGRFADGKFELDLDGNSIADVTIMINGTLTASNFVFWDDYY